MKLLKDAIVLHQFADVVLLCNRFYRYCVILCHDKWCRREHFYVMLFYILVFHCSEVWMCAEASHTSDKVEFHVIYVLDR